MFGCGVIWERCWPLWLCRDAYQKAALAAANRAEVLQGLCLQRTRPPPSPAAAPASPLRSIANHRRASALDPASAVCADCQAAEGCS